MCGTSRTGEPYTHTPIHTPPILTTHSPPSSNAAAWVAQLRDVYEVYEQGSPQFRLGLWRAVFSTPAYPTLFRPADEKVFSWSVPATRDVVADRVCSKSYIAVQSEEEKAKVRRRVGEILERGEGRVWVDEGSGVFEYPYETFVVVMRKK